MEYAYEDFKVGDIVTHYHQQHGKEYTDKVIKVELFFATRLAILTLDRKKEHNGGIWRAKGNETIFHPSVTKIHRKDEKGKL